MNKISNEERVRIFAAYWGAKCERNELLADNIGMMFFAQIVGFQHYLPECQLLLRDLSSITDEDAIEILKMDYGWEKEKTEYSQINNIETYGNRIIIRYAYKNKTSHGFGTRYFSDFNTKQTDFLRSKSYNIGYGSYSPQDLINNKIVKG